jgi:hypothetical protein
LRKIGDNYRVLESIPVPTMRDEDIRVALLAIEDKIRSHDFDSWRESFVRKHVESFSFEEENKLIYTGTH